jgi:hypothetical protein
MHLAIANRGACAERKAAASPKTAEEFALGVHTAGGLRMVDGFEQGACGGI